MGSAVRSPPAGLPEIKAHPVNKEDQHLSPRKQRSSLAAQGSGRVFLVFSAFLEIETGFQHVQAGRFSFTILSFWLLWEMRRSTPSPDPGLHSSYMAAIPGGSPCLRPPRPPWSFQAHCAPRLFFLAPGSFQVCCTKV